ncbi:V-type ATP synthase subunit C [Clostridium folliculivorans]|uniref:ATP synthase subunit C n=1 Tax=Clostridium folliculivorans TaxID=2886038 RepID=A0A9W5Y2Z5_9CLOT|nr:V-type ATP synthase subunit C [Clostridium folliculivorans]GKU25598.1 ATP synthase subunit C [Clostridium folliculivorans]GKU28620.1 ATP synthase subunit C [Clostridium folliculivorans]
MDAMDFTQVIPRLRVLENRLLDKPKFDRMIDSSSAEDALKILQETEYINVSKEISHPKEYEVILSNELKRVFNMIYDATPHKEVVDIMSIKYDFHNIKVLIKAKLLDKNFDEILIPVGTIEIKKLKNAIDENNYRDIPNLMGKAIETAFEDFSKEKDPQRIDLIVDNLQYDHMYEIANRLDDPFIEKYVDKLIDLSNIRTLLRVKKQKKGREFLNCSLIDGGKIDKDRILVLLNDSIENVYGKLSYTDYGGVLKNGIEQYTKIGSSSELEKLSDNYIMRFMKDAKYISFGPEPIIAYIYAKENEIKNIRIIMVGKLNNIPSEVIRERLREGYV